MTPRWAKRTLTHWLFVVAGLGLVWLIWWITHPLAPGSVSISISGRPQFAAGAPEKIKVMMSSVHGYPSATLVDWGDGYKDTNPSHIAYFRGGPCDQHIVPTDGSTPPPIPHVNVATLPPGKGYIEFLHRYRRPGTYRVTIHANEFGWVCTNQRSPSGSGSILLRVTGPVAPGNGLTEPRAGLKLKVYDYYGRLSGYFGADDRDGYVRSMTVTWVDGKTHVYKNLNECADHDDVWPSGLTGFRWRQRLKPGTYTVKITALSTDCAGGESQTTTLVVTFRLARTGDRIQVIKSTFSPHMPNGNGDISLPISEEEAIGVFETVP